MYRPPNSFTARVFTRINKNTGRHRPLSESLAILFQVGALSHRERVAEGRVRVVCQNVSSFEPSPWRFAPSLSHRERETGGIDRPYINGLARPDSLLSRQDESFES